MRSLACLPALVGAWRHVGGGLLQLPLWAHPVNWPAFIHPELATPGTRVVNQFLLGQALTGEMALDPPVTALMVYNSNPMVVAPEQEKIARGAGPRGPVHGGQRPLPHRHRALRRHRPARDDPARAARPHVQLGPLLRHAQRPGRRAGGGVDPQHRAVPAARGADGLRRRVLPPVRRGAAGAGLRLVGAGDGGHHPRVAARDGVGAAEPAGPRRVRPARRGELPDAVGQDRVPRRRRSRRPATSSSRCSGSSTRSSSPAAPSTRCRTTSRRARPARSTR